MVPSRREIDAEFFFAPYPQNIGNVEVIGQVPALWPAKYWNKEGYRQSIRNKGFKQRGPFWPRLALRRAWYRTAHDVYCSKAGVWSKGCSSQVRNILKWWLWKILELGRRTRCRFGATTPDSFQSVCRDLARRMTSVSGCGHVGDFCGFAFWKPQNHEP